MTKLNKTEKPEVKYGYSGNNNLQIEKSDVQRLMEYVASFIYGEPSFYTDPESKMTDLIDILDSMITSPRGEEKIANVLHLAKHEFGMRTMPIVALVEYLRAVRAAGRTAYFARDLVKDMISRVDDMTDMYAYALSTFGSKGKVPMALKQGIADSFNRFDAYQFGKYNRSGAVKLKDLLRITHPTPASDDLSEIFAKIVSETLESPDTWEVAFSENGKLPVEERRPDADIWYDFVKNRKLGMLATVRNLRNMGESGLFEKYPEVINILADTIRKPSKLMFPYQYYAAYRTALLPPQIRNALKDAINTSAITNIPVIGEKVWIIVDVSGSMQDRVTYRSLTSMEDIASLFGAAVALRQLTADKKVVLTAFSDQNVKIPVAKEDNVLDIVERINTLDMRGGTDLQSAVENVEQYWGDDRPDSVVIISDMQINQLNENSYYSYRHLAGKSNPHSLAKSLSYAKNKFAVNLNSEKTTPVSSVDGFHQLTGYSDSIFKYIDVMRNFDKYLSRVAAL